MNSKVIGYGERAPWGDFPPVIRNGDLFGMKSQPGYAAAKAGSREAALELVESLLTDETVRKVGVFARDIRPVLLPVLAAEATGNNKIPLAMAEVLGHRLGLDVERGIIQRERIKRTGSNSDHRLVFNPTFDGIVKPDQFYIILDDAVTMGGTVACLRGFVENRGGHVMAAAAMAARPNTLDLRPTTDLVSRVNASHGTKMGDLAKEMTGYGLEYLTQSEVGHFRAAASVDSMRTRLIAARNAGVGGVDEATPATTLPVSEQAERVKSRVGIPSNVRRL